MTYDFNHDMNSPAVPPRSAFSTNPKFYGTSIIKEVLREEETLFCLNADNEN